MGEFSPSRQVDRDPSENVDRDPGDNIVGTAIARDHNHGNRSNWDVICDLGTAIKQTSVADALTDYRPFSEMNQGVVAAGVFSELDQGFIAAGVFSALDQGFETGLPVGSKLRSDNRFVIEPVNLFQGLDAGSMNYAEAIGMDSSTVGVMNNVISNLQPANEII